MEVNKQMLSFLPLEGDTERRMFYSKEAKCIIDVHLRLFVHLADQPERREITSVLGGNGAYTGHWGWSVVIVQLVDKIPPCLECLKRLLSEMHINPNQWMWNEKRCDKCTQWETSGDHPIVEVQATGSEDLSRGGVR